MIIISRESLRELVTKQPKKYNAIIIHEFGKYQVVEDIVPKCNQALVLEMDDTTLERDGCPTKEQVELAVNSGFDIVSCHLGRSRSSAIAFLIECKKSSPQQAIRILDITKHFPNELILKHGLDVIGESIRPFVKQYYQELAIHRGWRTSAVTKFFL